MFRFLQEKEFELSEVFDLNINTEDKIHISKTNKYAYQVEDHKDPDDTVVTFVPQGTDVGAYFYILTRS